MASPIQPSALLRTAAKLAGEGAGPGRPAPADLRRATSTAYYALFHQLTWHGSYSAVWGAEESDVAEIVGWFTHAGLRGAAVLVEKAMVGKPPKNAELSAVTVLRTATGRDIPPELVQVVGAFQILQDARELADYGHEYDPTRAVTLSHVDLARSAVLAAREMWNAWWTDDPDQQFVHDCYCRFLLIALLSSGGPRTRRRGQVAR